VSVFHLTLDAQQVVGLRLVKFARGGPDALREASRMVSEKVTAYTDSQLLIFDAAVEGEWDLGADRVLRLYQQRVRANKHRLSRF